MDMQYTVTGRDAWLDKPVTQLFPKITIEKLLMAIIIIMTLFSRFYILGERVMSHDEVNHVVPSYSLYQGRGYAHDPVTHGPMQFHLVALSYFLLGDSDFSARTPAALFSVATVLFVMFAFRSYLGRIGALIGGLLFTISPYLLFYGRYTRNEAFVALFAVLTVFLMLRYLERGQHKYLYGLAAVFALQFITKETSFIYLAQFLVFVAFVFIQDAVRHEWKRPSFKWIFVLFTIAAIILLLGAIAIEGVNAKVAPVAAESVAAAAPETQEVAATFAPSALVVAGIAIVLGVIAIALLILGVGWKKLTSVRSFDLLMLAGTLVLPQLTAFPVKMTGVNPIKYDDPVSFSRTALFLVALLAISTVLGLVWKPRQWLISAGIFYSIYITFYTTFFTNGRGFFTGIIGSLGYWLEQQGVNRGSQPWYYYAFLQVPIYEYLAALGAILAFVYGLKYWLFSTAPGISPYMQSEEYLSSADKDENQAILDEALEIETVEKPAVEVKEKLPVLGLLLFLSVINLFAYSLAGEKMPWLTVHIAVPMLLAAAWAFGFLVESIKWGSIIKRYALIALALLPVFLFALFGTLGSLLGGQPPFQGKTLDQLTATSNFTFSLLATVASGGMLIYLLKNMPTVQVFKMLLLTFFSVMAVLTARVSVTSSYINYDTAKEFLVYAHAARGPKDILAQVDEISRRITGGKGIQVGYDNDSLYPYWWYFRDYPNHVYYGEKPTREIRNYQLVIVGQDNYSKVEPILKENFIAFEYPRLWWPTQVYTNITRERIVNALRDPKMRAALFDIWLNRDYADYATLAGKTDLTQETWQPSTKLRLYIRKDILSQIWNYGAAPQPVKEVVDPYKDKLIQLTSDLAIGQVGLPGAMDGQFTSPRGIAAAQDGSLYVADAGNHRIQHFDADGKLIKSWGTFADISKGDAPGGTFFEPWGVAVGPDGSVYVADTWNHRIQKFTSDGRFITMWGSSGQADSPTAFYGPRGIVVDKNGHVFVTDTGNKRVAVFDQNGEFITQFGEEGAEAGMFDEPVGIAIGPDGNVYVADTWNQRIQVFAPSDDGKAFFPTRSWDVNGWLSQTLDNKPFLAVDENNNVFITDPEGYRILQFKPDGAFVRGWGEYSPTTDGFGLPLGIAAGPDGKIWVSDSTNSVVLKFTLP